MVLTNWLPTKRISFIKDINSRVSIRKHYKNDCEFTFRFHRMANKCTYKILNHILKTKRFKNKMGSTNYYELLSESTFEGNI
jgi:hypothetical protein